ncbi:FapA family protein [Geotalea sp. SG265]|uniref:DUF342 domain-containing protein n=1 Tax=Geotalea sp. SG265 TaxID=2922867 RepID=UPI001FB0291C|nr:FapA family protein [Geotalea sp. SG265]
MTEETKKPESVGEARDGTLTLSIDPDLMSAHVTITPPHGGAPVTKDQVLQALSQAGVVAGILLDDIENAVEEGEATSRLIAAGRPPQPGEDSQFVSLIPEMKERCPLADTEGNVDYRNTGGIVSVNEGDPLLRRMPPTKGIAGENLLGAILPAVDGVDVPFATNLSGTAPAPDDSELLLAALSGLPVLVDRGVIVEPVLNVKTVDLSTGNLHFNGTVDISGDVKEGMEVTATGDILIRGVVEAANVEAGGNIEIKGGIIGQKEVRNDRGELNPDICRIGAQGSISAQFAEHALIKAGQDVVIREVAMKSDITAGNAIIVGEKGMRKGHIIGGICRAATLVHAIVVGSPANVATRIQVGVDPAVSEKMATVKQQLLDKEKRLEEVEKTLAYIHENPSQVDPGVAALKKKVHGLLQTEIGELNRQKKRLQKRLELINNARVEVENTIYFGAQIMVGDKTLIIEDDLDSKTFTRSEEGIVY